MEPMLTQIATNTSQSSEKNNIDEQTRSHIRNLDNHLSHISKELVEGREDLIQNLRNEVKFLARTIAASGKVQDDV